MKPSAHIQVLIAQTKWSGLPAKLKTPFCVSHRIIDITFRLLEQQEACCSQMEFGTAKNFTTLETFFRYLSQYS